jgi:hypothetical protein
MLYCNNKLITYDIIELPFQYVIIRSKHSTCRDVSLLKTFSKDGEIVFIIFFLVYSIVSKKIQIWTVHLSLQYFTRVKLVRPNNDILRDDEAVLKTNS